jgi:membrane protease YdiL (CAAX protease family)
MDLNTNDTVHAKSQRAESKSYPGFLQAVWLVVLRTLIVVLISLPILIAGISINRNLIFKLIIPTFAVGVVLWYGQKKTNTSFKESFPLSPIRLSFLFPILIILIGLIIISAEIATLVNLIIPMSESTVLTLLEFFNKNSSVVIIVAVIIGPFIEEFLFRGLILRAFLTRYSIAKSVLLSALLFGIYHLDIYTFPSAFLFGVFSGWLFTKTRSLLPCIFIHAINNTLIIVFMFLIFPQISAHVETRKLGPLWLDLLGVLLIGLGIWLSIHFFKKNAKDEEG